MITANRIRVLLAAVFTLWLQLCLADAPSGEVDFSFDNITTPIWDLSGGLQFDQQMQGAGGGPVALSFGVSITHDVSGRLHGIGETALQIGNDWVAAHYTVSGSSSGGGNTTHFTLMVRMNGRDTIGGRPDTAFSASITYHLHVEDGALVGTSRGHVRVDKIGPATANADDISVPLPAGMDGTWAAHMNIVPLQQLGGTASIVLSNGRTLPATISGSFSADTQQSRVKLKGINEGKGLSLNLAFETDATTPDTVRGRILGQTVHE